jgi:hypothetical protein
MLRRFHERFGTAGLVIAVIALIAALGGTALAASGALTGKQKKEVEKIAKKFQGTGPAGSAGASGAPGAKGKDGANGTNGSNGKDGTNGVSPAGTEFATTEEGHCTEGGVKFVGTTKTYACNGKKGKEGSPWVAGGTLPEGRTETGVWAVPFQSEAFESLALMLSFPIRLAAPLNSSSVHYINEANKEVPGVGAPFTSTQCLGTAAEPKANPGNLCMYTASENVLEITSESIVSPIGEAPGAATAGAVVRLTSAEQASGIGTWAVTAP